MKLNRIFITPALALLAILGSCVGDLNQEPKGSNQIAPDRFKDNPREAFGEVMAKCYSAIAVAGQEGPDGAADISGIDGSASQWSRAIFMLNELTTDEAAWVWPDMGITDLCTATWSSSNVNILLSIRVSTVSRSMQISAPSSTSLCSRPAHCAHSVITT